MAPNPNIEQLQKLLATFIAADKSTPGQSDEEWLTVQDAVQRYKISRWTIRRLRRANRIIAKKLSNAKSGKVLISKKSMDLWLESIGDFQGAQA